MRHYLVLRAGSCWHKETTHFKMATLMTCPNRHSKTRSVYYLCHTILHMIHVLPTVISLKKKHYNNWILAAYSYCFLCNSVIPGRGCKKTLSLMLLFKDVPKVSWLPGVTQDLRPSTEPSRPSAYSTVLDLKTSAPVSNDLATLRRCSIFWPHYRSS